jgi:phage repressor protein C with HTH and peptisase S24 domain
MRLLEYINATNISQSKFEKQAGISNGYINNLKDSPSSRILQKIFDAFPDLNREWLMTGSDDMIKRQDSKVKIEKKVHLMPISSTGGLPTGFDQGVKLEDCELITSPITDVDYAIRVSGDSMSPEYPNGSIVLIKRINEKRFIEWGRVYVLDTCNGAVVKKVMPGQDSTNINCISINPDYPSFLINKSDIRQIFRVLMSMSLK